MVTAVPTGPKEGEKEVITGAWAKDCKTLTIVKEKRNKYFFGVRDLRKTIIT